MASKKTKLKEVLISVPENTMHQSLLNIFQSFVSANKNCSTIKMGVEKDFKVTLSALAREGKQPPKRMARLVLSIEHPTIGDVEFAVTNENLLMKTSQDATDKKSVSVKADVPIEVLNIVIQSLKDAADIYVADPSTREIEVLSFDPVKERGVSVAKEHTVHHVEKVSPVNQIDQYTERRSKRPSPSKALPLLKEAKVASSATVTKHADYNPDENNDDDDNGNDEE